MESDAAHRAAHLRAYDLLEAVQGDERATALRELSAAVVAADTYGWPDVAFVLAAAQAVDGVNHCVDRARIASALGALVEQAADLDSPALLAIALGVRAFGAAGSGDTGALVADAARAVALLDDEEQSPVDRCVGYVVAGAAFNSLRLWELVDELYGRALEFGPDARASHQAAAVAVNRVLARLEWALAVVELGDAEQAGQLLDNVLAAAPAALAEPMPQLWQHDVLACADIASMLRGHDIEACLGRVDEHRRRLVEGGDLEVLPVFEAAVTLTQWTHGPRAVALEAAARIPSATSASSGARSFPLWVRAKVLAEAEPSTATGAQLDHSRELGRLLWQSRLAVLAAARAQIQIEQRRRDHEALSRAVDTDALTGLHNRRMFENWLRQPTRDAGVGTALLLIDIDDFKEVNDTFGHDCGDQVLRTVAALMASSVRTGDVAIRHGGDEFALIIEGEHLLRATVAKRAERLCAAIAGAPWSDIAPGLAVAVSIGVAVANRAGSGDAARIYKIADAALYRAKRTRSRIALSPA